MPRTAKDLHDYLSHPTTLLPEPLPLEEVIANIRQSHEQGGATFSRYFGDAVGQPLYAVSVYPDRTAIIPGQTIPAALLKTFIQANQDLLKDARNAVGTRYNREEDAAYLDITTLLEVRAEAVALARQYNQIAIYDLARQVEVLTERTGEEISGLPIPPNRLPALKRRRQRKNNG